ncbi:MAG: iron-containing alcohol dehydrogenase [Anaerolineales bacterium]|nr:iron-containing alcohol dehydrogenase [Anaerolineales bacterium]
MKFDFTTANRIIFGEGVLEQAGALAAERGRRALIVTGSTVERARQLIELLESEGLEAATFPVPGEPTVVLAKEGLALVKSMRAQLVLGFGGGSAIDAGKAIAALATNGDDPLEFLEVIGEGKPLVNDPLPYIAIPTTAGTGSEVTRNAVLASREYRVKVSLRSAKMIPDVALIDPLLTYSVPPAVTAYTGMDALTQVIEPYLTRNRNPFTDTLAREGMLRGAGTLVPAYQDGKDREARRQMAFTSLMGGLALANAGLGAVHGFAGPFGGMYDAPHGAICAALLPHVMHVNLLRAQERRDNQELLKRFDDVAGFLTGAPHAAAEDGVRWLESLADTLEIPPLGTYGFERGDFEILIEKASVSSSMKGNPVELSNAEMALILERAM